MHLEWGAGTDDDIDHLGNRRIRAVGKKFCACTSFSYVLLRLMGEHDRIRDGTSTTDLMWNNYIVEALCMVTNFVTEFLYDRSVVFRNSMNTNDVAKKDREKAEHKARAG